MTAGPTTVTGNNVGEFMVHNGTEIQFTANPINDSVVEGWFINGVRQSGSLGLTLSYTVEGQGNHHIEVEFEAEDNYRLVLRKTMYSINGSRIPANAPRPVPVLSRDRIIYTIRVYNEGNVTGRALEITDHLPIGMELYPDSTINASFEWEVCEADSTGRTVRTEYLANTAIVIPETNPQLIHYAYVQIETRVVATATNNDQILRNRAEITEDDSVGGNNSQNVDSEDAVLSGLSTPEPPPKDPPPKDPPPNNPPPNNPPPNNPPGGSGSDSGKGPVETGDGIEVWMYIIAMMLSVIAISGLGIYRVVLAPVNAEKWREWREWEG